jgi:hypothetical protein
VSHFAGWTITILILLFMCAIPAKAYRMLLVVIVFLILLLTAVAAFATDGEPVQIMLMTDLENHPKAHVYLTGDDVPVDEFDFILCKRAKCSLPIVGAEHMRLIIYKTMHMPGCWYPTLPQGWTYIRSNGITNHAIAALETYPHCSLQADKSVVIEEPNFNSATFYKDTMWRLVKEATDKRAQQMQDFR